MKSIGEVQKGRGRKFALRLLIVGLAVLLALFGLSSLLSHTSAQVGGGELLFTSDRDGNSEIYKMNVDGTNQQRLTNSPEHEPGGGWSPNGQKIVYLKEINETTSQIWVMNGDGSGQVMISQATGLNFPYEWSPDGQRILFTKGTTDSNQRIWVMNADGSNMVQLTNSAMTDESPSFSPDGAKIVFSRCDVELFLCDVFTMNSNGTNQTNLTPNSPNQDNFPNWTPDGTRIVFNAQNSVADSNVFIMNADGSNRLALTTSVLPQIFLTIGRFPVSPTGKVALASFGESNTLEIYSVGINGGAVTRLTNNLGDDLYNIWSPDGSKLGFESDRDAVNEEIYTMNSDGTGVTRLTFNPADDVLTDWYRPTGGPTLGNYPATSVNLSGNATITPDAVPTGATSITVSAPAGFNGRFVANATTGVIRLTNAQPAKLPPGAYPITVRAFGPGGMATRTFNLTVTTTGCGGTSGFTSPAVPQVTVGTTPLSVAVGDFNGDGIQDFATTNFNSNTVSIRLGNGSGGFTSPAVPQVTVGLNPISLAVGDFNGDGIQDFAAANVSSNNVSIRLGNGSGGFTSPAVPEVTVGTQTRSVAVGDFNGDGIQDFAAANLSSNNVSIRLGNGSGGFVSPAVPEVTVVSSPESVAVGDFNGDGIQDLATANPNSNNASIRLGNGSGGFTSPAVPEVTFGTFPTSVAVGDFNGDGIQDFAAANQISNNVSIRLGNGSGGFTSPAVPQVMVGTLPSSVAVGDFNGDGILDFVAANRSADNVSIRLGNGSGGFTSPALPQVTVGNGPRSVAVGDFNGDGIQDFAAANQTSNNVSIRLGTCSGPTCAPTAISYGDSFNGIFTGNSCVLGSDKTDLYTFTGTANQQVAITMETSQFFSRIELLNPAGTLIATAGGVNGVNNSRLPTSGFFTLPAAGTYTIRAIAAFGGAGSYNISLFEAPVVTCTYSLSPTVTTARPFGAVYFFDVLTQPGCPPGSQPASSGMIYNNLTYNGGRVSFNVSTNEFPAARTDTITVAGQTHTINQFGLAAPTNDGFAAAQVITGLNSLPNAPVVGNNTTATAENGEPTHAGSPATSSVWYRYTPAANASGLYSFSTSGSSFDTVMAIYACPPEGACTFANMTPVGSNDDTTFFDITSKVNFRADGGTTYMIAVDGKNGASGTVILSWRQYERLFRLYLQTYNGTQSPLVPNSVTASNGTNTVTPLIVSLGVYEFNLPADGTTYIVTITGPTGIIWDPNNFPLDTSFRYRDELMRGDGTAGGQNSVSNAQNQTPRFIYGYIRNITATELTGLGVIIGSSRGPNPREETPCSPLASQVIAAVPYATYQCLSQPNTLHDIVPNMAGKIFTVSVLSFDVPVTTTYNGTPGSSFIATNTPTFNINGTAVGGGAGTEVALVYTPTGNPQAITLRTMTPASGAFAFPNLAPNTYQLRATKTGAVFTQPAPVNLQSNQTIDIPLESACSFTPGQSPNIPVAGGLSQITVNTSQTTCEWLAASDVPWITINSGAIVGNGPVHFTAQANAGGGRIGSIRIQGRPDPILIQQATTNPTFGTLAGRVLTPDGRALRNAVVTLIDAAGTRQTATTSSFGVYNFDGIIQLGQIYTATVSSKRYRFAPRTLAFTGNLSGVEFVGLE